jgi:hypothetical protein
MRTVIATGIVWIGIAVLIAWAWYRLRAYEKWLVDQMRFAIDDLDAENDPPERDFVMERSKHEAQMEDAEEARRELACEDFEAQMERLREKRRGDERLPS